MNYTTFFIVFLIQGYISILIAQYNYKIEQLTSDNGLSHNCVRSLFQDSKGFLWIGTEDGLNKFDGYNISEYFNDPDDSTTISNNWIWTIYEDPADSGKILWLGTKDGLNKFNRETAQFTSFQLNHSDSVKSSKNWAHCINKVNDKVYLIGGSGLKIFEKESGKVKSFIRNFEDLYVYTIFKDSRGDFWIGSNLGLFLLSPELQKKNLNYKITIPNSFHVLSFYEDGNGIIWIGTDSGFYTYSPNEDEINLPIFKFGNTSDEVIYSIFEDSNGYLMATSKNGLITINPNRDSLDIFHQLLDDLPSPYSRANYLPYNQNVISAFIDETGLIWIGTCCNGLYKFIPDRNKFKLFRHSTKDNYSVGSSWITSFCEDRNGNIYVGTIGGHLNKFDTKTERFLRIDLSVENYSLRGGLNNDVWYSNYYALVNFNFNDMISTAYFGHGVSNTLKFNISQDNDKNDALRKHIWDSLFANFDLSQIKTYPSINYLFLDKAGIIYCVFAEDNGKLLNLHTFNPLTKNFYSYDIFINELVSNSITSIYEDNKGNLWFGTEGKGLIKRVAKTNNSGGEKIDFIQYRNDKNNNNSISSNTIFPIQEDENGFLWIGTDNGLNKFNPLSETFIRYGIKEGLPSNKIAGLLVDDRGFLWISTNKGLSKFNPHTEDFKNYDIKDGLQSDNFSFGCNYKAKNGDMYFGGPNGFNSFNPKEFTENPFPPNVVITQFTLFNQVVKPGEKSPLKNDIELSKDIILDYEQDIFTLEFVALDFTNPLKNQYAYKMDGVNFDWIYTNADRRFATYTNLDPGEYTFRVKASNSDGVWNEKGASIRLTILPPWYRTNWAYLLYTLATISLLTFLSILQKRRLRIKHEMEMKDFESMKLKEVDQMKSKFFANISHEFRTPLTLIKGPIERLISDKKVDDPKKIYKMIKRNSERLLNLINELLDLSKLESGHMKLSTQRTDIVSFAKGVAMSFESLALKKEISITVNSIKDIIELYIDKEKIQKILSNIISNAFKFTPQSGKIELDISENLAEQKVIIKISDTGIGIPDKELPKIFDRFYQVEGSNSDLVQGTGIGLALTKELVEMHQGTIRVISVFKEGTTFILSFPLGHEHLKEDEIIYEDVYDNSTETILEDEISSTAKHKKENQIVLVVEDNLDVQNFIKEALEKKYKLVQAVNGQEGFEKAKEYMPDLIVSDIMMPKESGDRMCERLKRDQITSHIPIILLTAKASQEDKIHGLETGADDYLIKPFNEKELLIRINNLIKQRHKLREKYLREAEIHPTEVAVTSVDKKFIEQIIKLTNENLSQPEFNIERFADKLAMSRTQLYRKFNSILGEKPTEFVRKYRIRRSAELMKQNFGNIAQIAYEVGFNNLSYFAKCFRKIYKISPHEYYKNLHTSKSSQ